MVLTLTHVQHNGDRSSVVKLSDVVVGEVWLAVGQVRSRRPVIVPLTSPRVQSNLEYRTELSKEYIDERDTMPPELASPPLPMRVFTVAPQASSRLSRVSNGTWQVVTRESFGEMSAVAYVASMLLLLLLLLRLGPRAAAATTTTTLLL